MKFQVKSLARAALATGLLSMTLAACGDNTNTPVVTTAAATTAAATTTAPLPTVASATVSVATIVAATTAAATTSAATTAAGTTAAATTGAAGTTAAATATTATETGQVSPKGVQALTDLGKNLDDTKAALDKNDLAAAKAAYTKFD